LATEGTTPQTAWGSPAFPSPQIVWLFSRNKKLVVFEPPFFKLKGERSVRRGCVSPRPWTKGALALHLKEGKDNRAEEKRLKEERKRKRGLVQNLASLTLLEDSKERKTYLPGRHVLG